MIGNKDFQESKERGEIKEKTYVNIYRNNKKIVKLSDSEPSPNTLRESVYPRVKYILKRFC